MVKSMSYDSEYANVSYLIGLLAISIGGGLSAFLANLPSRHAMWSIAFIVLVLGVAQILLGRSILVLKTKLSRNNMLTLIVMFNLACILVLSGVIALVSNLIIAGTIILLSTLLYHVRLVGWHRGVWGTMYYSIVSLLFISASIGMVMALTR